MYTQLLKYLLYLHFGGSSFRRQYTGHILNFEELNRATPSVFICSDKWISTCFCSALVPLKKPSFPKCLRYNCPSKMSSILISLFFFLVKRYWRRSYTSSPIKDKHKYNHCHDVNNAHAFSSTCKWRSLQVSLSKKGLDCSQNKLTSSYNMIWKEIYFFFWICSPYKTFSIGCFESNISKFSCPNAWVMQQKTLTKKVLRNQMIQVFLQFLFYLLYNLCKCLTWNGEDWQSYKKST